MITYQKAEQDNCTIDSHGFIKVQDKHESILIRKQLPKMTYPLWYCKWCDKIIESS